MGGAASPACRAAAAGALDITAEATLPYTSHRIGSRNPGHGLVMDGDGDGIAEVDGAEPVLLAR